MNHNFDDYKEMPAGLRMALTKNLTALNRFASLSTSEQLGFIRGAHQIGSSEEMDAYVNTLLRRE